MPGRDVLLGLGAQTSPRPRTSRHFLLREIEVRVLDDSQRLRSTYKLEGEVDLAVAAGAEAALYSVAVNTPGEEVELDCGGLTFIDASGVTMLLHVAARTGKFVHLVNLAPNCRRVFEVLGLCEWFGIDAIDPMAVVHRLPRPA